MALISRSAVKLGPVFSVPEEAGAASARQTSLDLGLTEADGPRVTGIRWENAEAIILE